MKESGLGTDPLQRAGSSGPGVEDGAKVVVRSPATGIDRAARSGLIHAAVGVVEVRGFVPMVAAMDAMAKAANVELMGYETSGEGIVAALIQGEVGAVRYAVDAGAEAARRVGEVLSTLVLARPDNALAEFVPMSEDDLRRSRATPTVSGQSM